MVASAKWMAASGRRADRDPESSHDFGPTALDGAWSHEIAARVFVRLCRTRFAVTITSASTLPHLTASIRVLEKAGFRHAGKGNDPHAPAEERVIRYELSRDTFVSRVATGSAT